MRWSVAVYKTPRFSEVQKLQGDVKLEVAMEKCTAGVEALVRFQYHPAYEPATKEEEISGQIGLATRTITEENSCHFSSHVRDNCRYTGDVPKIYITL
jgi:hypothetical protein